MIRPPVRTTCPYCGVGCGVIATPNADRTVGIAGDKEHPANFGRLCSKGSALGETLALDDRLLEPLIEGKPASWDAALELVARTFCETIAAHGPDSVALYVSGQILTEDYYVANKLMKGFVGSANIDTNSRLCMASSVAGHKRAFGADTVPGTYEDLELADVVVLVGSNLAWCHPILYQRLAAAKLERGTKVVVVDPRRTATCEIADVHLAIAPGSDVALFNGLLAHLVDLGVMDAGYVGLFTSGAEAAIGAARGLSLADTARVTGLDEAELVAFYRLFAATERVMSVYSQGVNQSSAGTDKVNAIINCHLLTGRIGKPGMGPFSVTGQPNAMGGREVGGMANMLAAHMDLGNTGHRKLVQAFWASPVMADKPGLKAVDMFRAVGDGRIKAIWIMSTNPVDSLPEADAVRAALEACPFVVVSDVIRHTDTTAYGHVLLPATGWGEKDGTVTNSERRISRQRAFLDAPGQARADWWQIAQVAKRMGFGAAFAFESARDVFTEHARLSGYENEGVRDFDIGAYGDIGVEAFEALEPFQWPQKAGQGPSETRFFAEGQFYTDDRKGRFIATPYRGAASQVSSAYPMVLNTGRIRDQWHTMTRTGKTARLMSHLPEPFVEIHPEDARTMGVREGHLARVESAHGSMFVRARIAAGARRGSVFAPIHWTDQLSGRARVDALMAANLDPISGQPELKFTPVRVSPFAAAWHGFAVSAGQPHGLSDRAAYWTQARAKAGWSAELAGAEACEDWTVVLEPFLGEAAGEALEVVAYHDGRRGQHRTAAFAGTRLVAALFVGADPLKVDRTFLAAQLGVEFTDVASRYRVLAGRAPSNVRDKGAIVCSCFEVGRNEILEAILADGEITVAGVGACTKAGTNCGSCRSEIGALIAGARVAKAG